jgi:hypothetical protein
LKLHLTTPHAEWAGLDCDYDRDFPKRAQRTEFYVMYLAEAQANSTGLLTSHAVPEGGAERERFMDGIDDVVSHLLLASHTLW